MLFASFAPLPHRLLAWLTVILAFASTSRANSPHDISAPVGFEITLYADDDLAHDVYSLTVDSQGRVVVSGPGYVRILVDTDQDEVADSYQTYADAPATGAQGMTFDGSDLYCTGDGGLLRFRDSDGDGRADGPPEVLVPMKTGGEHFAHSVQKGPDGWWYVLLGNLAGVTDKDVTTPHCPVRAPAAGVLMRLSPDFATREVIADGFRNPYDFVFARGELFTFDSDGERDVSLPWYRPTRVFQVLPGCHAGWISDSWKRPDEYPDMPAVTASCGRGSPTGLICYRHPRFPARYHDTIFALDWTFGRIMAITLTPAGSVMTGQVETFVAAKGQFGFAPTDLAVTPDGDLMVSVGGRGTRGGVYRIRYVGEDASATATVAEAVADPHVRCLRAPQPDCSWSRAQWIPEARRLGRAAMLAAAQDQQLAEPCRVRALEILAELFEGLSPAEILVLHDDPSPAVRARAAWLLALRPSEPPWWEALTHFLADPEPRVVRTALETALYGVEAEQPLSSDALAQLRRLLDASDRDVRRAAIQVLSRCDLTVRERVARDVDQDSLRAQVAAARAAVERRSDPDAAALTVALRALATTSDPALMLDAVRLAQQSLGDAVGGRTPPVYDGYASAYEPEQNTSQQASAVLERVFPTGECVLDYELSRLIAMLAIDNAALFERLVRQLTDDSDPVDDIHYLIVLSRLATRRSDIQRQRIARALVRLEQKLKARGMHQDLHWDVRVSEMYQQLVRQDAALPAAVVARPDFGRPGHILFAQSLQPSLRRQAAERIVQYLGAHAETPWTSEVVTFLASSPDARHRSLIREKFDDLALQGAVIRALADAPQAADLPKYVHGLTSPDFSVMRAAVNALELLPASEDPDYQFALLHAMRRLGVNRQEIALRDRIERLLRHNLGQDFGYEPDLEPTDSALAVITLWTDCLRTRFPDAARQYLRSEKEEQARLQALLAQVAWEAGQADRGLALFQQHSCSGCHNARTAIGPDLTGVARRFSREDVFTALLFPNRDVSPRYHTTLIETSRGSVISGLVIYESVDGVTLRDSTNQTLRVESSEIDARRELPTSLMPTGLLDTLQPPDLADLYAYLQTL
jgi:putative membrane-bound dehydrogenase-like protein